jgi:hypothetical protein
MQLEEKWLVRTPRVEGALRQKEWWFSDLHDPRSQVYMSWSFARAFAVDKFRLWLCDLAGDESWSVDHNLYLDRAQAPGVLDLRHRGAVDLEYRGDGDGRAVFRARTPELRVELEVVREGQPFTRRDNYFRCSYALFHQFFNRVRGEVEVGGRRFAIDTARSYYDHCFGVVPRRASWQWLAVQNDDLALASLVNHGPYAQRYTQVYWQGSWHRLDPDVDFDYDRDDLAAAWRVRSRELDLLVRPRRVHRDHVSIPPLVPFLVDLQHNELFVEVEGEVRLGGARVPLQGLTGVAEEHDGRW